MLCRKEKKKIDRGLKCLTCVVYVMQIKDLENRLKEPHHLEAATLQRKVVTIMCK